MKMDAIKESPLFDWGSVVVAVLLGLYTFTLYDHGMPLPEGWYSYFAMCMQNGERPYYDFEYLMPPIYLNLIYGFTKIFGYDIFCLRVFGALIVILLGLAVYAIVKSIYQKWVAVIAAITSTIYGMYEVTNVFYDYSRIMDLCADFALLFLILGIKRFLEKNEPCNFCFVISGIICSLFIMTKQNSGLIYFVWSTVALVVSAVYMKLSRRAILKFLLRYILVVTIPIGIMALLLLVNGSLLGFLSLTSGKALAAKGGVKAILLDWIINLKPFILGHKWKLFLAISVFFNILWLNKSYPRDLTNKLPNVRYSAFHLVCLSLFIIICLFGSTSMMSNAWIAHYVFDHVKIISTQSIFFLNLFLFLYVSYKITQSIKSENDKSKNDSDVLLFSIIGAYLAISYGSGTSGALVEGQAVIGLALLIAFSINFVQFRFSSLLKMAVVIFCAILCLRCMAFKLIVPYAWWESIQPNWWECTEETYIPLLRNIKISPSQKKLYEGVYEAIMTNTSELDAIYCFPRIPIFYVLTGRHDPGVVCKEQWFDFASQDGLRHDMHVLNENPPKMIIMYETSNAVTEAHEKAFNKGNLSVTRQFQNMLLDMVDRDYEWIGSYSSGAKIWGVEDNPVNVYLRKK